VDFRELKRLQREEMKEGSEFYARIKVEKDIQEKKFEGEKLVSHVCVYPIAFPSEEG